MFTRKTFLIVITTLFVAAVAHAQKNIIVGTRDTVYSNTLHENRQIWVHAPENNAPDGIYAQRRCPVIYVLDGDDHFKAVVAMVERLSQGGPNIMLPPVIVVGILNTDRNRDLTPTHVTAAAMMDSESVARSGGGDKFISFLEKELIPHIDSLYPTAPYRVLIGHSLGGLMAIHSLLNHTRLFNAYIAIDPSVMWDDQKLVKQAQSTLGKNSFAGRSLYLAVANNIDNGMPPTKDTTILGFIKLHTRSIMELEHALEANPENGLRYSWKYYPEYNHGTVPLVAEYDGLRTIFSFYNYNLSFQELLQPNYKGDTAIVQHYETVSSIMGYKVSPEEELVNVIGYNLIQSKQFDRASYFLKMNIDNYPKSFNAYDSMGDLYEAKGDHANAKACYLKSLAIRETPDTRRKLEQMNKGK
ncbi:alpha/beta hydrolase-fold protein [Chitinophaga sp. GbtcB8]|uniref:alpha/beta hydrolase-fold protein n=1 Tax=Chitinophaga sp. GbtcB8 TaxID=2824753 RepID=UPI001C30FBE0|nr:alpha/beta hydrolase-fold protein [Chitinophaga sp. GbtcB8]